MDPDRMKLCIEEVLTELLHFQCYFNHKSRSLTTIAGMVYTSPGGCSTKRS